MGTEVEHGNGWHHGPTRRRRLLGGALGTIVALASLGPPGRVDAADFTLVTSEEHAEALAAPETEEIELVPKSVPGAPRINVLSPTGEGSIDSPVDIEVRFEASGDASIDMASLKVYYLMLLKKDVTDRILEHAEVDGSSIRAPGATLPSGRHKFLVEIRDSEGRKGSEKFVVDVDA